MTPDRNAASDPDTEMPTSGSKLVQLGFAGAGGTRKAAWH
jgi:hypothetical protein